MTEDQFMQSRTELELHFLQFLRDTGEPMEIEFYKDIQDFHCLDEFVDGYWRKTDGFSVYNIEKDSELESRINLFLEIVQNDKNGSEYSINNFILIEDLVSELGL